MDGNLLFLQSIYRLMEKEGVSCSFAHPTKPDHSLFEKLAEKQSSTDYETLSKIAECLRRDTSDFICIEEIISLLDARGFYTAPRHDF